MKKNNVTTLNFILSILLFLTAGICLADLIFNSEAESNPSASNIVKNKVKVVGKEKVTRNKKSKKTKQSKKSNYNIVTEQAVTGSNYQPYIQFGGMRFFHSQESRAATTADIFIPIWQKDLSDLVFADLRIIDRTGTPFEGNLHLGYRHYFLDKEQMIGVYGAWDRKKSRFGNYFNQMTLGGEYWIKNWFIGANYYWPIFNRERLLNYHIDVTRSDVDGGIGVAVDLRSERAMTGTDAEVGYEFKEGLIGYVGGYYYGANNVATVYGPRARISYDWSLANGRILGIFDKVGVEAGIQRDKPRGVTGYLGVNVRIGCLLDKKTSLKGLARHMIDPVRRDVDIVSGDMVIPRIHTVVPKKEIENGINFYRARMRDDVSGVVAEAAIEKIMKEIEMLLKKLDIHLDIRDDFYFYSYMKHKLYKTIQTEAASLDAKITTNAGIGQKSIAVPAKAISSTTAISGNGSGQQPLTAPVAATTTNAGTGQESIAVPAEAISSRTAISGNGSGQQPLTAPVAATTTNAGTGQQSTAVPAEAISSRTAISGNGSGQQPLTAPVAATTTNAGIGQESTAVPATTPTQPAANNGEQGQPGIDTLGQENVGTTIPGLILPSEIINDKSRFLEYAKNVANGSEQEFMQAIGNNKVLLGFIHKLKGNNKRFTDNASKEQIGHFVYLETKELKPLNSKKKK